MKKSKQRKRLCDMSTDWHDHVMMAKYDHFNYAELEKYADKLRKKTGYTRKVNSLYRLLVEKEQEMVESGRW